LAPLPYEDSGLHQHKRVACFGNLPFAFFRASNRKIVFQLCFTMALIQIADWISASQRFKLALRSHRYMQFWSIPKYSTTTVRCQGLNSFSFCLISTIHLAASGVARRAKTGAGGRTRTGTGFLPTDFKSVAATITPRPPNQSSQAFAPSCKGGVNCSPMSQGR
jgi:hypothetical protein